jgi:hypothetical protein
MGLKFDKAKYERYSIVIKKKEDIGSTQLAIAMKKAYATVNAKLEAGKMKPANAAAFKSRICGLKPLIGTDEDSGLLQVAQIIGAINKSL